MSLDPEGKALEQRIRDRDHNLTCWEGGLARLFGQQKRLVLGIKVQLIIIVVFY